MLHSILSQYAGTQEPIIQQIRTFFYDKSLKNNAVSEAILGMRKWLKQAGGSTPPFSYQDFFELLTAYGADKEGWLSQRAILDPQIYQERSRIVRDALKQTLDDLKFLKGYIWLYATGTGQNDLHLFEGQGDDLKPVSAQGNIGQGYKPGHIYLFRESPADSTAAGFISADIVQQCPGCNQARTFWIWPDRLNGADLEITPADIPYRYLMTTGICSMPSLRLWSGTRPLHRRNLSP